MQLLMLTHPGQGHRPSWGSTGLCSTKQARSGVRGGGVARQSRGIRHALITRVPLPLARQARTVASARGQSLNDWLEGVVAAAVKAALGDPRPPMPGVWMLHLGSDGFEIFHDEEAAAERALTIDEAGSLLAVEWVPFGDASVPPDGPPRADGPRVDSGVGSRIEPL